MMSHDAYLNDLGSARHSSPASGIPALIVMMKYPEPGQVKTRLIPALGAQGAADLHARLVVHTLQSVSPWEPEIHYANASLNQMQDWLKSLNLGHLTCRFQGAGNLGDRMARAFAECFAAGCDRAVMIGTDCPAIDTELITQAFDQLEYHGIVLGPAVDGGYYLIGLRSDRPQLLANVFCNIAWSTATVLQETLAIVAAQHQSAALLTTLPDIDRPEDLAYLSETLKV
jgi:uncharacterized protein